MIWDGTKTWFQHLTKMEQGKTREAGTIAARIGAVLAELRAPQLQPCTSVPVCAPGIHAALAAAPKERWRRGCWKSAPRVHDKATGGAQNNALKVCCFQAGLFLFKKRNCQKVLGKQARNTPHEAPTWKKKKKRIKQVTATRFLFCTFVIEGTEMKYNLSKKAGDIRNQCTKLPSKQSCVPEETLLTDPTGGYSEHFSIKK